MAIRLKLIEIDLRLIGKFTFNNLFSTDIFKAYDIPILHVNANDIDAVIKTFRFAFNYKLKYKKDIVIDLIGFRKYGHNEVDEPSFTQPLMYNVIRNQKSSAELLKDYLLEKNILKEDQVIKIEERFTNILNSEFEKSKIAEIKREDITNDNFKGNKTLTKKWKSIKLPQDSPKDEDLKTGISKDRISEILKASITLPKDFKVQFWNI